MLLKDEIEGGRIRDWKEEAECEFKIGKGGWVPSSPNYH